jgi:hypothetical protein
MATTKARQDLRSKFVRNAIPTEQDFKDLIDAQLNQKDDGIFRNPGEPLSIVAGTDPQKRTLLLYSDDTGVAPDWLISLNPGKSGLGIATGDGNLLLFIDRSGKIGIGTNEPKAGLEIHKGATNDTALRLTSSGPGWGSGLQLSNTAPGEKTYGIYSGLGGSLHIADVDNSVDRLVITSSGSIGIGKSPNDRLDVDGRIRAGALTIGPWPASPLNYAFIGSNLQDQTNDGNYALLVGTGAEVGTTYLNGSASIGLRIGNTQHVTIAGNGNVGIGTNGPGHLLDVGGRMRVRQMTKSQATAGIWFSGYYSSETDHAFVGMKSINEVGFWGNTGAANWRLWVNTDNGNLNVAGNAFKPGGGAWGSASDLRLKQNIRRLEGALETLLKLRGVSYEWKNPESQGGLVGPQLGFVAQEVESVFPDWVGLDGEGFKTLTIRGFEALVVEALKELKAENASLRRQLAELQEQIRLRFPELVNL